VDAFCIMIVWLNRLECVFNYFLHRQEGGGRKLLFVTATMPKGRLSVKAKSGSDPRRNVGSASIILPADHAGSLPGPGGPHPLTGALRAMGPQYAMGACYGESMSPKVRRTSCRSCSDRSPLRDWLLTS